MILLYLLDTNSILICPSKNHALHKEFVLRSRTLIKNAFEENDLLKNLEQSQLEAIVDAMYSEDYEANQNIITEGERGMLILIYSVIF